MRRRTPQADAVQNRAALGLFGLLSLASAQVSALFVRDHILLRGVICGAQSPHCGWCYAAAAFALAGVAAFAAAMPTFKLAAARPG
jgi:hypothetical protein